MQLSLRNCDSFRGADYGDAQNMYIVVINIFWPFGVDLREYPVQREPAHPIFYLTGSILEYKITESF